MWFNRKPNVALLCVSINDQMIPPMGESHIRVYHLVLGWTILDCNTFIWFYMWSVAVLCGLTLDQVLHSNVVEPKTRCCNLMCVNQWPNDTVICFTPLHRWFIVRILPRNIQINFQRTGDLFHPRNSDLSRMDIDRSQPDGCWDLFWK